MTTLMIYMALYTIYSMCLAMFVYMFFVISDIIYGMDPKFGPAWKSPLTIKVTIITAIPFVNLWYVIRIIKLLYELKYKGPVA